MNHGARQMERQDSGHASSTQHPPSPCWRLGSNFQHLTWKELAAHGAKMCEDWPWLSPFPFQPHAFTDIHLGRQREEAQSLPVFNVIICATSHLSFNSPQVGWTSNLSLLLSILSVKFELADWTVGEPFDKPTWSTRACLKMRYAEKKKKHFLHFKRQNAWTCCYHCQSMTIDNPNNPKATEHGTQRSSCLTASGSASKPGFRNRWNGLTMKCWFFQDRNPKSSKRVMLNNKTDG